MGGKKTALTVRIDVPGLKSTLNAFRTLPKDATQEIRDGSQRLAEFLAAKVRQSALGDSRQSALMAPTVKAVRDRVPVIQAGGAKKVGSNRVPAWKVLFGSEFGSDNYPQFRPFKADGYWFFPVVDVNKGPVFQQWQDMADRIIEKFTAGGDD